MSSLEYLPAASNSMCINIYHLEQQPPRPSLNGGKLLGGVWNKVWGGFSRDLLSLVEILFTVAENSNSRAGFVEYGFFYFPV